MNIIISKIANFLGHHNSIYRLHKTSDKEFLSAGADGMLVKWNLDHPEEGIMIAKTQHPIYCIHTFKESILLGLRNGAIHVLDKTTNAESKQLLISESEIFSITSTPSFLFIGTGNGMLYKLNDEFKVVMKLKVAPKAIRSLHIMNDFLFVGSTDYCLYQLDFDLNLIHSSQPHNETIFAITHANDELITGSKDATINFYDDKLKVTRNIEAHWFHVKYLDVHPNLPLLLSTSMDKTLRIWNTETKDLLKVIDKEKLDGHSSSVNCGLWLNKNTVISCSDDRAIMAFKIEIE